MMEDPTISHRQRLWLYAYGVLISIFLLAPIAIVIPISFSPGEFLEFPPSELSLRWYRTFFSSTEWMSATVVSVKAALLTVVVATPLGVAAAYGLHVSDSRFAKTVRPLLIVPLIVPVIIIAIGVFYLYARMSLINTLTGLVLAHSVLALPFVFVLVAAGLQRYDMAQEMVARSLGASRLKAFLTVTLPQIRPSVISAALFAFITSFDEVVIALFVSRGPSSTLTRKMFTSLRDQVSPTIAAISTILILITLVVAGLMLLAQLRQKPEVGATSSE
ncbi:putative spermidine/putrescine transport system permease protein [Rhodoligotrophos appendicifer]|uniref:ABC transporter permease n=1 Tax=Rhodoligotrophos appendicifer TaxID=987056 RepID=UPI0011847612|nr:ABC transporter permease [Rhodoligotrophos appendicifer]